MPNAHLLGTGDVVGPVDVGKTYLWATCARAEFRDRTHVVFERPKLEVRCEPDSYTIRTGNEVAEVAAKNVGQLLSGTGAHVIEHARFTVTPVGFLANILLPRGWIELEIPSGELAKDRDAIGALLSRQPDAVLLAGRASDPKPAMGLDALTRARELAPRASCGYLLLRYDEVGARAKADLDAAERAGGVLPKDRLPLPDVPSGDVLPVSAWGVAATPHGKSEPPVLAPANIAAPVLFTYRAALGRSLGLVAVRRLAAWIRPRLRAIAVWILVAAVMAFFGRREALTTVDRTLARCIVAAQHGEVILVGGTVRWAQSAKALEEHLGRGSAPDDAPGLILALRRDLSSELGDSRRALDQWQAALAERARAASATSEVLDLQKRGALCFAEALRAAAAHDVGLHDLQGGALDALEVCACIGTVTCPVEMTHWAEDLLRARPTARLASAVALRSVRSALGPSRRPPEGRLPREPLDPVAAHRRLLKDRLVELMEESPQAAGRWRARLEQARGFRDAKEIVLVAWRDALVTAAERTGRAGSWQASMTLCGLARSEGITDLDYLVALRELACGDAPRAATEATRILDSRRKGIIEAAVRLCLSLEARAPLYRSQIVKTDTYAEWAEGSTDWAPSRHRGKLVGYLHHRGDSNTRRGAARDLPYDAAVAFIKAQSPLCRIPRLEELPAIEPDRQNANSLLGEYCLVGDHPGIAWYRPSGPVAELLNQEEAAKCVRLIGFRLVADARLGIEERP